MVSATTLHNNGRFHMQTIFPIQYMDALYIIAAIGCPKRPTKPITAAFPRVDQRTRRN